MDEDLANWRRDYMFRIGDVFDTSRLLTPGEYVVQPSFRMPVPTIARKYKSSGRLGLTFDGAISGSYAWDYNIFGAYATQGTIKKVPGRPHWTVRFNGDRELHSQASGFSNLEGYRLARAKRPPSAATLMKREVERLSKYMAKTKTLAREFHRRQVKQYEAFLILQKRKCERVQSRMHALIARGVLQNSPVYLALERKLVSLRKMRFVWRTFRPRPYTPKWINPIQGVVAKTATISHSYPTIVPLPVTHKRVRWTKPIGVMNVNASYSEAYQSGDGVLNQSFTLGGGIPLSLACEAPDSINVWPSHFECDTEAPIYDGAKLGHAIQSMIPTVDKLVDIPLALYELGDMVRLLTDLERIAHSLRNAFRSYGEGHSEGPLPELFMSMCGADLMRKFGIDPTIRDGMKALKGVLDRLGEVDRIVDRLLSDRGKVRSYNRVFDDSVVTTETPVLWKAWVEQNIPEQHFTVAPGPYLPFSDDHALAALKNRFKACILDKCAGEVKFTQTVVTTWRVTAHFSYVLVDLSGRALSDEEIRSKVMLDRFGLGWNPEALWDAVPFSFVVDWFLNIGDIIDHYAAVKGIRPVVSMHNVILSRKTRTLLTLPSRTINYNVDVDNGVSSEGIPLYERCTAQFMIPHLENIQRDYRRWLLPAGSVIDTYQLPIPGPPTWEQAFTGMELLMSIL